MQDLAFVVCLLICLLFQVDLHVLQFPHSTSNVVIFGMPSSVDPPPGTLKNLHVIYILA